MTEAHLKVWILSLIFLFSFRSSPPDTFIFTTREMLHLKKREIYQTKRQVVVYRKRQTEYGRVFLSVYKWVFYTQITHHPVGNGLFTGQILNFTEMPYISPEVNSDVLLRLDWRWRWRWSALVLKEKVSKGELFHEAEKYLVYLLLLLCRSLILKKSSVLI